MRFPEPLPYYFIIIGFFYNIILGNKTIASIQNFMALLKKRPRLRKVNYHALESLLHSAFMYFALGLVVASK